MMGSWKLMGDLGEESTGYSPKWENPNELA